jgi:Lon-like ATP-dependent protease
MSPSSGYDQPEKMEIARKYLDPKIRAETGLDAALASTPKTLRVDDSALEHLIRWYAREAGVRGLEKLLGKVFRKAAIKIVQAREARKAEGLLRSDLLGPDDAVTTAGIESDPAASAAGDTHSPEPSTSEVIASGTPAKATEASSVASDIIPRSPPVAVISQIDVEDTAWTVTAANLEDYVGKPLFTSDRLYESTPPGVVMGLAWTSMGGSALYIEVVSPLVRERPMAVSSGGFANTRAILSAAGYSVFLQDVPFRSDDESEDEPAHGRGNKKPASLRTGGGSLKLTGKMGDVMQESAQISYTVARRALRLLAPDQKENDFLDTMPLHMHVPEGATPKDGTWFWLFICIFLAE